MSIADPFAGFDLTPYQTSPQLPLQSLVVLSKALSSRLPMDAPNHVLVAEKAMAATTTEAAAAMVVRLRETNAGTLAADLAFDNAVDGLYTLGRERLRGWSRYLRAALDFLLEDPDLEFETVRVRAATAERLAKKLFAEDLTELLGRNYTEQSQLTANLLALIDEDGHADDLADLAGAELLPILRRCQVEYEAMVDRRSDTRSRADLRTVRGVLRRRIVNYASMVLSLLDESQPQTRAIVETALMPMVSLRPVRASPTTGVEDNDGDQATVEDLEPAKPEIVEP